MRIIPDGIYYACGLTLVGIALSYYLTAWIGVPFYLLAAFCLYFFRDPDRTPPAGNGMLAPADGKVVAIKEIDGQTRVSIFLNIFNVHVNRTPIPGRITNVTYHAGKFLNAGHEAASAENEQNTLSIEGEGTQIICRQIAGLIARRIVCYKKPGDTLTRAERIGYIKFGSRVDIIFGPEWNTIIRIGQQVRAGRSVVADRCDQINAERGAQ
ncbi:MAG TPA: phosphatidylserine decarboxylase [Bryobacteraceae bacterium]|nr:phosphatidylserine decarboxylase [Bryobacteraceae bacterium]